MLVKQGRCFVGNLIARAKAEVDIQGSVRVGAAGVDHALNPSYGVMDFKRAGVSVHGGVETRV